MYALESASNVKNLAIATMASITTWFMAIEAQTAITIAVSVVLPVIFFFCGKAIDALVQIYIAHKKVKWRTEWRKELLDEDDES